MSYPSLTGFSSAVTVAENTVNATPLLLDTSVAFSDADNDFNGGVLSLSGLLAEDTISVLNRGTNAGQIGFSLQPVYLFGTFLGTVPTVTYGGTKIGTVSGGAGTTLTVTFNGAATSAAVDALIESLTYANSSDTPTTSRNLVLNVTDAAGAGLGSLAGAEPVYVGWTQGDPNNAPFVSTMTTLDKVARPGSLDLDLDGDLDTVIWLGTFLNEYIFAAFENVTQQGVGMKLTVTPENEAPVLTGFTDSVTFAENTVNSTGQLLDANVNFSDFEGNFSGGLLTVSGLLSEDIVSVRNVGTGAGEIGVNGTNVTYGGVFIGTLGGGVGAVMNVVFTALATSVAVDALIQNLTYANTSDTPTTSRNLVLNVSDASDSLATFVNVAGASSPVSGLGITVHVTPESDAPIGTGLPVTITTAEDIATEIDLSTLILSDSTIVPELLDLVLKADTGTLLAANGSGVTVTGSGSDTLTLRGTVTDLNTLLAGTGVVSYLGAQDAFGSAAATLTATVNDGSGAVAVGSITVDITAVADAPTLTGLAASVSFAENTVNGTAQLLDANVSFFDAEDDLDGGTLTVSGLLDEDTISVRNFGTGAGEVGLDGTNVTFGGVVVGTLSGGVGYTLSVALNAAATSVAVDAVIQNLMYANTSDAPTASRDLVVSVTDAAGEYLGRIADTPSTFVELTGAANPVNSYSYFVTNFGLRGDYYDTHNSNPPGWSNPSLGDWDGDGDFDLVVGERDGALFSYRNDGVDGFTPLIGTANPFDGVNQGQDSTPSFGDWDGDGDLDLALGDYGGDSYGIGIFENDGTGVFTRTSYDPMGGVDKSRAHSPSFFDLPGDGDGDLDLVVGVRNGTLRSFENDGTGEFTELTGAANPFDSVDVGEFAMPDFVDLDSDGDLDLVVGAYNGLLRSYRNDGADGFTELTGAANPFNGVDVGVGSSPSFGDLDGDGDLDLVVGTAQGYLKTFENTTSRGIAITVAITLENDPLTVTGLPALATVVEDAASGLDLRTLIFSDADITDLIDLVLTADTGTLSAASGSGVTVTGSGSGTLTLRGTAADLNTRLAVASVVSYLGVKDTFGAAQANVTATANDGTGAISLGAITIDITNVADAPVLTGLAMTTTFAENTVNGAAQLLDVTGSVSDADGDFDGGTLTVSGLLGEDTVSVRNVGVGTEEVGLDGTNVTYGGLAIGSLSGGVGTALTVTFNANSTSGAIDALMQNLTYANTSDTPTTSRDLVIEVTDAQDVNLLESVSFTALTGPTNFLDGFSVDPLDGGYAPSFFDLDNDGDLDLVLGGASNGRLHGYRNDGADGFTALPDPTIDPSSPFYNVSVSRYNSRQSFGDLDGDGDLDILVGGRNQGWDEFENDGAGGFAYFPQEDSPFNQGPDDGESAPTFIDLDNDGDLDLVVGRYDGRLDSFIYDSTTGVFLRLETYYDVDPYNGIVNLFYGMDFGSYSVPNSVDLDGDGDLDLVVGASSGLLYTIQNDGAGGFARVTGAANPFDGIRSVGSKSLPAFLDMDDDGDFDLVLSDRGGNFRTYENTTVRSIAVTVNVTPETDAPVAIGLPATVTAVEDIASGLDLRTLTLSDGTVVPQLLDLVLTTDAGTLSAVSGSGVTATGAGSDTLILRGTATDLNAVLAVTGAVSYLGAQNAYGAAAATLTATIDDGAGAVPIGTVVVNVTPENDAPTATGLPVTVTAVEDIALGLDLSALTVSDADGTDLIDIVLAANAGTLSAANGSGVTVTGSGSGTLTLRGTATDLNGWLAGPSEVSYLGAQDAHGVAAATLTATVDDGTGAVSIGSITVDINRLMIFDTSGRLAIRLTGTSADETLLGGETRLALLTGGDGADFFVFNDVSGMRQTLRITDYDAAEGDRIDLGGTSFTSIRQIGANVIINLEEAGDRIFLYGTDATSLQFTGEGASDF